MRDALLVILILGVYNGACLFVSWVTGFNLKNFLKNFGFIILMGNIIIFIIYSII